MRVLVGRRGGTRTHDPLLRRQMLYPPELRARHADSSILDDLVAACSHRISRFASEHRLRGRLTGRRERANIIIDPTVPTRGSAAIR